MYAEINIMVCRATTFISTLIFILFTSSTDTLPSFMKPCRRSQSDFDGCIINLLEGLKTQLPNGISEMKIQPLNPLELSIVDFGQEHGLVMSIDYAIFKNMTVKGGTNLVIKNASIDFGTPKMTLDIDFPFTRVNCEYNISASTLFLPVSGDGIFDGNFTNVSSHNVIYGQYYTKDNKEYVKVISQEISLDIGSSAAFFEDSGNSLKNTLMNDFWPTLFGVIKSKAEVKIGEIAVSIFKDMLEMYQVQDFVPN